jgi:hypothetical protein
VRAASRAREAIDQVLEAVDHKLGGIALLVAGTSLETYRTEVSR